MTGPFDEDEARRIASTLNKLTRSRRTLTDKEMLRLQAPGVELEYRMKLQGRAGYAWFYSIKGLLDHHLVQGCMYRHAVAVVISLEREDADGWARAGLIETLDALREYWLENKSDEELAGITVATGGRKAGTSDVPLIHRNPEFYEFLRSRFDVRGKTRH